MPEPEKPAKLSMLAIDAVSSGTEGASQPKIQVQFNPNLLNRAITVSYQQRVVLGLSHQPHEYLSTENQGISFAVFYNVETRADLKASRTAMAFLESLAYGPGQPGGIVTAAPSRVLIVWPKTLSITARLMSVTFKHERWNQSGDTIQWSAACTFEASSITRIVAKDIRSAGTTANDDAVAAVQLF